MNLNLKSVRDHSVSFSADDQENLQHGTWRVDCSSIELRQRDVEKPHVCCGPGFLFQDEEHQLGFRLYVTQEEQAPHLDFFSHKLEAGQIIPETSYYDLTALDEEGRLWRSDHLLMGNLTNGAAQQKVIWALVSKLSCEGHLPELSQPQGDQEAQLPRADGYGLNLVVFGTHDFPKNKHMKIETTIADKLRDHHGSLVWVFEAAGCDWELRPHANHTEIRINSPFSKLPDDFKSKLWLLFSSC